MTADRAAAPAKMDAVSFEPSGRGDCFSVAFKYALDHDDDPSVYVCHGQPIGRGPQNNGVRFWHAWVEVGGEEETGEGATVLDNSNGHERTMPRALYYAVGDIAEDDVRRYPVEGAAYEAAVYGHYGPWDDEHPPG